MDITITGKDLTNCEEVVFITCTKVKKAIDSFKPLKAPGPDGIKAKVLQWLGSEADTETYISIQSDYILSLYSAKTEID